MKKLLTLVIVMAAMITTLTSQVPPIEPPKIFAGVPAFTGNMYTDPFWWSYSGQIGSIYYDIAQASSDHINSVGAYSYQLGPMNTVGHRSVLYFYTTNTYANSKPLWHNLHFWYKGSWRLAFYENMNVGFSCGNESGSLFPNLDGTNSWTYASFSVPPITNSGAIKVSITLSCNRQNGGTDAYIDAVQWTPVYPPMASPTNFFLAHYAEGGNVTLSWYTNAYSGYTLQASPDINGSWQDTSPSLSITNGICTALVSNGYPQRFFRLKK